MLRCLKMLLAALAIPSAPVLAAAVPGAPIDAQMCQAVAGLTGHDSTKVGIADAMSSPLDE